MAGRTALSPLTTAMYALDGAPRITHIWPYPDLDERLAIRERSTALTDWPPKQRPRYVLRGEPRHRDPHGVLTTDLKAARRTTETVAGTEPHPTVSFGRAGAK